MPNRRLTYRNRVNGEIDVYPEELAKHFPNLEEVAPDAKPLAYVPIEQDAIDAYEAERADGDSEPEDKPVSGKEGKK